MGTRGFLGFVVDGTEKIQYNHSDSYPSGLGLDVLHWATANAHALHCDIHQRESGGPADLIARLRVVDPNSEPSDEDIARLAPWTNTGVGERRERPDWYQLLRGTQGDPAAILTAGTVEDAGEFPLDSVFAEWGYLIDLDAKVFEVYEGFQEAAHDKGRFATRRAREGDYRPCALVASWPLDKLPSEAEFMAALEPDSD